MLTVTVYGRAIAICNVISRLYHVDADKVLVDS